MFVRCICELDACWVSWCVCYNDPMNDEGNWWHEINCKWCGWFVRIICTCLRCDIIVELYCVWLIVSLHLAEWYVMDVGFVDLLAVWFLMVQTRGKAGYVISLANTRKSRTLRVLGIVCECWMDVNVGLIMLKFVSWWIKIHDLSFSLKSQMSCIHYLLTCSYSLRLLNLTPHSIQTCRLRS